MVLYIGVSTYIMEPCVRGKSSQFPEVGTDKYRRFALYERSKIRCPTPKHFVYYTLLTTCRVWNLSGAGLGGGARLAGLVRAICPDWVEKGINAQAQVRGCRR